MHYNMIHLGIGLYLFTPNFSGDDQLRTLLIDAVIDADINRLYDAVIEFIKGYAVIEFIKENNDGKQ